MVLTTWYVYDIVCIVHLYSFVANNYSMCVVNIYQHCSILDHVSCSTWLREDLSSDQTPSKQAIENEEKLIGTFKVIHIAS